MSDLNEPINPHAALEAFVREIDQMCVDSYNLQKIVPPAVFVKGSDGHVVPIDVMPLFQAPNPQEAARRKAQLIPTVRGIVKAKEMDVIAYVFCCQGYRAPEEDEKTSRELKEGKATARLTHRVSTVFYAAEGRTELGEFVRLYGEREIIIHPRSLGPLSLGILTKPGTRVGYGILDGIRQED